MFAATAAALSPTELSFPSSDQWTRLLGGYTKYRQRKKTAMRKNPSTGPLEKAAAQKLVKKNNPLKEVRRGTRMSPGSVAGGKIPARRPAPMEKVT